MFHVYVDPIHGDDFASYFMNAHSGGTTWNIEFGAGSSDTNLQFNLSRPPTDVHPGNGQVLGNVIHATFPFKTITGKYGVLKYLTGRVIGSAGLPTTVHASNGQYYSLKDVVVHCLPGLYGPKIPMQPDTEPNSGLAFNGETFPVLMLDKVSFQGASALDTIFDARNWRDTTFSLALGRNAVFAFLAAPGTSNVFRRTFVDSITIRNNTALNTNAEKHRGDGSGAAIYIGGEGSCAPTISNNFIVNNQVGIAIETDTSDVQSPQIHWPVIVNNTIARNGLFQIWSGDRTEFTSGVDNINWGRATPLIYDNIMDAPGGVGGAGSPFPPTYPLVCCGIHWDDMIVTSYSRLVGAGNIVKTPVNLEFNAYQIAAVWSEILTNLPLPVKGNVPRYTIPVNSQATWPLSAIQPPVSFTNPNVPAATVVGRTGSAPRTPPFQLRVDITPWSTKVAGLLLGTFYVADVFRNYLDVLGSPRSQHDFRQSPMVRVFNAAASVTNPVVGMGINTSLDGAPNAAGNIVTSFEFGLATYTPPTRFVTGPQGILPHSLDYPSAAKHEWDFDGEGFGNDRIVVYVPINPMAPYGDVDLGADEVDELVMSGYLDGTRTFSRTHTVGSVTVGLSLACQNPYYFGVTGQSFARPNYTFWEGLVEEWFKHIEYPMLTAIDKNWSHNGPNVALMPTATAHWTNTFDSLLSRYRSNLIVARLHPGIPRNQWCDYATLLLPDPKPWGFIKIPSAPMPSGLDNYCMNSWYNNLNVMGSSHAKDDNQDAYWHPYDAINPNPAQNNWNIQYSQPFTSIVSPPGTMINDVTRTGQVPPPWIPINWVNSHLWLDVPFKNHLFVDDTRFGHYLNPGASTAFDAWGVGDSGNGGTSVDQVPYTLTRPWYGLRMNCESSRGGGIVPANRTNLQSFLIVQGLTLEESQSKKGLPSSAALPRLDSRNVGLARTHLTDYMKSDALRKALAARKTRIEAMRKGGK